MLKLRDEEQRIEARMRALGLDRARAAAAGNIGLAPSPAKRQLLRSSAEEARRQGRTPPFAAKF